MNRHLLSLFLLLFITDNVIAQKEGLYGNEWIKYDKTYVRVGVVSKGIQKINVSELPASFMNANPETFQLWYKGREIPIISASSKEILFYGEPNNGSTDSLLFRPTTSRLNSYVSLFSDEASYFLTISPEALRVTSKDGSVTSNSLVLEYHFRKVIKTFNNQFAFSIFGVNEGLNNSFYEASNSYTSQTIWGPKASSEYSTGFSKLDASISLKKYYKSASVQPKLEILLNGLNSGSHNVHIYFGMEADSNSLNLLGTVPFNGFAGSKISYDLSKELFLEDNYDGLLRVKTITDDTRDWFGLSYVTLEYPQLTDMMGDAHSYFSYKASDQKVSRVKILNVFSNTQIFDISDIYAPVLIKGKLSASVLEAEIERKVGKELNLLVQTLDSVNVIPASRIYKVDFDAIYSSPSITTKLPKAPGNYDFLMVTHDKLHSSSIEYAKYRSSELGGSHRTLLVDIRKIYDEFNYGEPSPLGIRKFVDYMLSAGIRSNKHNLLLIGHSVSWSNRLVKEMPGEVPTFGDPGSDMLLVSGLNGVSVDVPAIPVGRINAFSNQEVLNYLAKVDTYEHEEEIGWRKNILHLNGGHSVAEINQLKTLLSDLVPDVENGVLGGTVQAFVKRQGIVETEKVNISGEVNGGVGMITYFGHGSQTKTDLDLGYVTDATRGFSNSKKYPLMFFNGCGVGNIFASRLTHTLSSDWLLAANKGAIAVVSNSYMTYVSPSSKHLQALYKQIFQNSKDQSIGQILISVAKDILATNPNTYDIANLHQAYIQGDPSIIALRSAKADYAIKEQGDILIYSEKPTVSIGNSKTIKTAAIISNGGRLDKSQRVPVRFNYYLSNGVEKRFDTDFLLSKVSDTLYHEFTLSGRLDRIEVQIDPKNSLNEINKNNNSAILDINWENVKDQFFYSGDATKDIVPPILTVFYNNKLLGNNESIIGGEDFRLIVEDDRYVSSDLDDYEVFIKSCPTDIDCEYTSIRKDQLLFNQISSGKFEVRYSTLGLPDGEYQLLISARDKAGNYSVQPYSVNFRIEKVNVQNLRVVLSPNPASDYVKFKVEFLGKLIDCRIVIYNDLGIEIAELIDKSNRRTDTFEIYWQPKVKSGVYFYKLTGLTDGNELKQESGRFVLIR